MFLLSKLDIVSRVACTHSSILVSAVVVVGGVVFRVVVFFMDAAPQVYSLFSGRFPEPQNRNRFQQATQGICQLSSCWCVAYLPLCMSFWVTNHEYFNIEYGKRRALGYHTMPSRCTSPNQCPRSSRKGYAISFKQHLRFFYPIQYSLGWRRNLGYISSPTLLLHIP